MAKCGNLNAFVRISSRHQWPHTEVSESGSVTSGTDFTTVNTFTAVERVSLHVKLSRYPCLIPTPTSSHFHPSLVTTLPDDLAGARPRHIHHYPYISLSISGTVVRIKFQIPRPSHLPTTKLSSFFSLLTSGASMRWWRNAMDTWSRSICVLGCGPESLIISSPPRWREWRVRCCSGCRGIT